MTDRDPVFAGAEAVVPDPNGGGEGYAMSDHEFEQVVRHLVEHARDAAENDRQPDCEKAWRYYHGEVDQDPMGEIQVDGRTQYQGSGVVETRVRDTIHQMLPDLYRVFLASSEIVEFEPRQAEDVESAKQATDVIGAWFWRQEGARFVHDALLDWSIKFCAVRTWAEPDHLVTEHRFGELNEQDIADLQADPTTLELEAEGFVEMMPAPVMGPQGPTVQLQPVTFYRGFFKKRTERWKKLFALIPQEELLLDGDAQKLDHARVIGTDSFRTVSEIVALGIDYAEVKKHAGGATETRARGLNRQAREDQALSSSWTTADLSTRYVRVVDAHVRVDRDGDGMAEVYHVIALGEQTEVVIDEPDEWPDYVVSSPFLLPHKIVGEGLAEAMIDRQDIATSLIRRGLDSINRTVHQPLMCDVSSQDEADALTSWYADFIPIDQGRVGFLQRPFVGDAAFSALQVFQQGDILRSGISPAGQGLNPAALKGQTVEAAQAIVSAPQSRVEFLARVFAETVMKPLFAAMLRLFVRYPNPSEVVRLRNKFVPIDSRGWSPEFDMSVKVGLGTGSREEKLVGLQLVIAKQEAMLATGSPLVDLERYRAGLADLCATVGIQQPDRYFLEATPEMQQQAQEKAQAAQQQAAQVQAQLQAMVEKAKADAKAEGDAQVAQIKAQLEERLAEQENMFKQQQEQLKFQLKQQELAIEAQIEVARIRSGAPAGNGNLPTVAQ